jgi:hypothetical protein
VEHCLKIAVMGVHIETNVLKGLYDLYSVGVSDSSYEGFAGYTLISRCKICDEWF